MIQTNIIDLALEKLVRSIIAAHRKRIGTRTGQLRAIGDGNDRSVVYCTAAFRYDHVLGGAVDNDLNRLRLTIHNGRNMMPLAVAEALRGCSDDRLLSAVRTKGKYYGAIIVGKRIARGTVFIAFAGNASG